MNTHKNIYTVGLSPVRVLVIKTPLGEFALPMSSRNDDGDKASVEAERSRAISEIERLQRDVAVMTAYLNGETTQTV